MAASGMRSRMESLDLLANNIANASTGGYKADREFYSLVRRADTETTTDHHARDPETVHRSLARRSADHRQSHSMWRSPAQGFFTVQGPSGPLYTRNGSFRLDSRGQVN